MITEALSFEDFDHPPEASVLAVDSGLDLHNHATAPLSDVESLGSFASDRSGLVVGGAVGRTWGTCCELLQLWVESTYRKRGVASRLLQQFEKRAAGRGCNVFYLTTLSFQAPDFYRKRGYASIAVISGYPDGITRHLMYKEVPGVSVQKRSPTISRHWRGVARTDQASAYEEHLRSETFPALRKIEGFVDATILKRLVSRGIEFLIVTRWSSMAAIEQFAGGDAEAAVVPENVRRMMVEYDQRVRHYEVAQDDA